MSAEDKLREIAALHGWSDDLLEQVQTLLAVECNVAFDHGRRVEHEAWARRGVRGDAARYRWIKAQKGLDLRSEKEGQKWTRADGSVFYATHSLAAGGTQFAPAESLDAMIDAAMAEAPHDD